MNFKLVLLAAEGDFISMSDRITELYKSLMVPMISIFVGAAFFLGLWLGLKFILAGGDEQKLKKAKESVKYFVIGLALIFLVTALLPVIVAAFQNWAASS